MQTLAKPQEEAMLFPTHPYDKVPSCSLEKGGLLGQLPSSLIQPESDCIARGPATFPGEGPADHSLAPIPWNDLTQAS